MTVVLNNRGVVRVFGAIATKSGAGDSSPPKLKKSSLFWLLLMFEFVLPFGVQLRCFFWLLCISVLWVVVVWALAFIHDDQCFGDDVV